MFNTSTTIQPPAGGNSTGLFGNTTGPLQSTPTSTNPNTNNANVLPNLFQTVQKTAANTNTGGLFGNRMASPTPANNPTSLFGNNNISKPSLFGGNILSNNNTNQQQQQYQMQQPIQQQQQQQQGICAYGVQINPLTISITSDIPPPLVNVQKPIRSKRANNNNSSLINSFKVIPQQSRLLLQKQPSVIVSENQKENKGSITKPSTTNATSENHVLRKLTINKEKIDSLKKILFESSLKKNQQIGGSSEKENALEKQSTTKTVSVEEEEESDVVISEEENNASSKNDTIKNNGYWCLPSIENLSNIDNFIVGRENHGSIHFLEPVDLTHLTKPDLKENLFGRIVQFYDSEPVVEVYPDEFEKIKPSVGEGLNVRAIINLQNVEPDTDLEKFVEKLNSFTDNEFVSYDPFSKNWCFKVRHFSKYGLVKSSVDGHREIHSGRVVKSKLTSNKKTNLDGIKVPGFLNENSENLTPDYEIIENENDGVKTHTVEILSVPAKEIVLSNENIVKEMAYEPKNVDVEDLKELINETYMNSFKESKDLIEELNIANELGNGSIFKKNKLREQVEELDSEEQIFLQKKVNNINVEENKDEGMEIESFDGENVNKTYKISSEGLQLINTLQVNSKKAVNNDKLPFIIGIDFGFKDLQNMNSIFAFLSLLLDNFEEDSVKLFKFTKFLNRILESKIILKNGSEIVTEKSLYLQIFEKLSYRDIAGAVQLSYKTENPQLSVILSSLSVSNGNHNSGLATLAKLQLELLETDLTSDAGLVLIYKVLANDFTLLESEIVEDWTCKLLALLNYSALIENSFKKTLLSCFGILKNSITEKDPLFKILSLFVIDGDDYKIEEITGDLFVDFVIFVVLNFNYGYSFKLDEYIKNLIAKGEFETIYDNLFLALFLESNELKFDIINEILKNNIDLVLNEVSNLQSKLLINDDIIYTIQGEYYGTKNKKIKELDAYMKTRNNDLLIENLIINKTGPYLIFINKESLLLDIIQKLQNVNDSVHIMELYALFKLSGNRDMKLLNELVEKITLFKSNHKEIVSFLYKFTVEQFIINFNTKTSDLKLSLINNIKMLKTDDETTNVYLERVVKSLNL
ncbi:hypothetical protein ACO0SA_001165 [Hanseniaspora valbyensis]